MNPLNPAESTAAAAEATAATARRKVTDRAQIDACTLHRCEGIVSCLKTAGPMRGSIARCLVFVRQLISLVYQCNQKLQFGLSTEATFDRRPNHCFPQKEPEEAHAKCPAILECAVSTRGVAPS